MKENELIQLLNRLRSLSSETEIIEFQYIMKCFGRFE